METRPSQPQPERKRAKTSHHALLPEPAEPFPIDLLGQFQNVAIDPWAVETLTEGHRAALQANIQLCRDAIVVFTACGKKSGYGGHTGGAYDTVPEVMLLKAFFAARPDKFVPVFFDEAGHRVATQYLLAVLKGALPANQLRNYRKGHACLPGHPELGITPGVDFSSGRLGHMWPYVNGVAMAHPDKIVFCLGSDGSQMEGNDAEAARLAVGQKLNVKLLIDDNNVTIAGHPSEYLPGWSVEKTLRGHGVPTATVQGEDLDALYAAIRAAVVGTEGPAAVVAKRPMCPGVPNVEGTCHGHDALAVDAAKGYFAARGLPVSVGSYVDGTSKTKDPQAVYLGSDGASLSNRNIFGQTLVKVLDAMDPAHKRATVRAIDSDLEGSVGFKHIAKAHPDIYVKSGIMERGNFSAAAGFGMSTMVAAGGAPRQGVFSTFAAFLEMCTSEITMARLNRSNVLCHFSHSGVDDMADNSCHFGLNNFFADNGLEDAYTTRLYFPADGEQMEAVVRRVFPDPGLRFVFSTRSKLPRILDTHGRPMFAVSSGYTFVPGKDEIVRDVSNASMAGFVVSFGDALYRALDAVERLRAEGMDVGLMNKPTLNVCDEEALAKIGRTKFVVVVESLSRKTGLGVRFGTWLLERGFTPRYSRVGTCRDGSGGLWEQAYHQGYDADSIVKKVREVATAALAENGAARGQ